MQPSTIHGNTEVILAETERDIFRENTKKKRSNKKKLPTSRAIHLGKQKTNRNRSISSNSSISRRLHRRRINSRLLPQVREKTLHKTISHPVEEKIPLQQKTTNIPKQKIHIQTLLPTQKPTIPQQVQTTIQKETLSQNTIQRIQASSNLYALAYSNYLDEECTDEEGLEEDQEESDFDPAIIEHQDTMDDSTESDEDTIQR